MKANKPTDLSMLRLEKVNGKNVWELLKLTVSESQRNYVATNEISIITSGAL